jgi:hypothetical protein
VFFGFFGASEFFPLYRCQALDFTPLGKGKSALFDVQPAAGKKDSPAVKAKSYRLAFIEPEHLPDLCRKGYLAFGSNF